MKTFAPLALSLLLFSIQILIATDDNAAFADFQRLAGECDFGNAFEEFKRNNPSPSSKPEELEAFKKRRVEAAMVLLDKAKALEAEYPQSNWLPQVRALTLENLYMVFGALEVPVPQTRIADLEAWIREELSEDSQDDRPYMILIGVARGLSHSRQVAALEELSKETTPEHARSRAKDALKTLKRLGQQLELKFTALDGRVVDLAAFKGKVVLIDFWSTTCVPCVRDMPESKRLYNKYKTQGFEVIGITLDEDKEVLERFIHKEEIPWPQYYHPEGSQNPLAQEFAIRSVPTVWLVDRRGVLRYLDGTEEQERKVVELLKEH